MSKEEFRAQYQSPHWQKKRLEILNRDEWKCQKCDDTETQLHVHHLRYLKNKKVWQYDNKDLDTLCRHCHEIISDIKPSLKDYKKMRFRSITGWDGGGKILFMVHRTTLNMRIYDSGGGLVCGYNLDAEDAVEIRSLCNHVINNTRKNG